MNLQCDKSEKCSHACSFENIHDVGVCADISFCQLGNCAVNDLDFNEIVEKAFHPRDGKKDPHQYHVRNDAYDSYQDEVKKSETKIKKAKNFDEILKVVTFDRKGTPQHIKGIGELTEYDIAFRIGKCLKKCPDKLYLHAGTKEGFEKAIKIKGLNKKYKTPVERKEIAEVLSFLQYAPMCQIENFLCVCKDDPTEESFKCYTELHLKSPAGDMSREK